MVCPPFHVSVCPSPALGLGWFGHWSVTLPAAPGFWALLESQLRRSDALASGRTLSFFSRRDLVSPSVLAATTWRPNSVFSLSIRIFLSPADAGIGVMIGSPVGLHGFGSFSPSAAFSRRWFRLQVAGVCSLGHHLRLCFVSSCFHNDFDSICSLVPFVAVGAPGSVGSPLFPL